MTGMQAHHGRDRRKLDTLSAVLLVVALVVFAAVLTGMAAWGTSPLWLLPPAALAIWNLATLRK